MGLVFFGFRSIPSHVATEPEGRCPGWTAWQRWGEEEKRQSNGKPDFVTLSIANTCFPYPDFWFQAPQFERPLQIRGETLGFSESVPQAREQQKQFKGQLREPTVRVFGCVVKVSASGPRSWVLFEAVLKRTAPATRGNPVPNELLGTRAFVRIRRCALAQFATQSDSLFHCLAYRFSLSPTFWAQVLSREYLTTSVTSLWVAS